MTVKPINPDAIVAVIGAGAMGAGIATVAALAGHRVLLHDADWAALERGVAYQRRWLAGQVDKGRLSLGAQDEVCGRIVATPDMATLAAAELVIEAVVERLEVKVDVLMRAAAVSAPDAILASNTSSLSITALAARLPRPDRIVGMHFFNPATLLPLVEVVSGSATSPAVAACIAATARAWGKVPVQCSSTPGFIVNRVARPFYGEALRLLAEGAADPATIDAIQRESGGFRMGPFELMDMIGHDVNFAVTRSVYQAMFEDPRYRPSLVQQALVDAGWLGRKSGRGFFDYGEGATPASPDEAPRAPPPSNVVLEGDLGNARALVEIATGHGLTVDRKPGTGMLRIDGVATALTDGRTATARSIAAGEPVVLFDLALDYAKAGRIGLTTPASRPDAVTPIAGFFQAIGKSISVIDDAPGMVVARTVAMLANEAADAVHQRVASAADIDLSMRKGVNYPRGPLAWADALGADYPAAVLTAMRAAYGEDRYRISPLLSRVAATGGTFLNGHSA